MVFLRRRTSLQRDKLNTFLQIGDNIVDQPHTWVYDNLQYQFNVGAERLDNQKSRIDSTAGFVTEAILSRPDMRLPTQGSFNPDILKAMDTHLLPTSYEDAMFKKEVLVSIPKV
jgi:hypothetical protein